MQANKYALYRAAVQDPAHDVELYQGLYKKLRGRKARSLREDFCGTFSLSCEWVKSGAAQTAMALDLDPEPLDYGRRTYWVGLNKDERSRLKVLRKNVISLTPSSDLIVAGNFSFCIFKDRPTLLRYFRHCVGSLKRGGGALLLDFAGGPDMLRKGLDRRRIKSPDIGRFTYEWETKSFDPLTYHAKYAIHFTLPGGKKQRNAFTYDWRHWTIPELRDVMAEAGFKKTVVFWDVARSDDHERLEIREKGEDLDCYLVYVAGLA